MKRFLLIFLFFFACSSDLHVKKEKGTVADAGSHKEASTEANPENPKLKTCVEHWDCDKGEECIEYIIGWIGKVKECFPRGTKRYIIGYKCGVYPEIQRERNKGYQCVPGQRCCSEETAAWRLGCDRRFLGRCQAWTFDQARKWEECKKNPMCDKCSTDSDCHNATCQKNEKGAKECR